MSEKEYCEKAWANIPLRVMVSALRGLNAEYKRAAELKDGTLYNTDARSLCQKECDRLCGRIMQLEHDIIKHLLEEFK